MPLQVSAALGEAEPLYTSKSRATPASAFSVFAVFGCLSFRPAGYALYCDRNHSAIRLTPLSVREHHCSGKSSGRSSSRG